MLDRPLLSIVEQPSHAQKRRTYFSMQKDRGLRIRRLGADFLHNAIEHDALRQQQLVK